tara:strand:+ start:1217 stop:1510 length:294 start_codon:yes stop_codon:yes gene_type:complete
MARSPFERSQSLGSNVSKRTGTPPAGYGSPVAEQPAAVARVIKADVTVSDAVKVTKAPAKKGKKMRAHTPEGKFRSDDPSTPDVNEAWVLPEKFTDE